MAVFNNNIDIHSFPQKLTNKVNITSSPVGINMYVYILDHQRQLTEYKKYFMIKRPHQKDN